MSWILLIAGIIIAVALLVSIALFYYACVRRKSKLDFEQMLKDEAAGKPPAEGKDPQKQKELLSRYKWLKAHSTENIELINADGLKIRSYFLPHANPKGTIIAMHGYRSRAEIDFAPQYKFLWELGYNLMVIKQRSHEGSEGKYITFGVKERFDCKMWAEYAEKRFGKNLPIFLSGISMGAATVMMASELDLPKNVKGIIADCGYTSPWDIAKRVLNHDLHLPGFPVMYITDLIARIFAGFSFKEASAIGAMKKCRLPVLFIHGDADNFVPIEMTFRNYEACISKHKKLLVIKSAAHAAAYVTDTTAYEKAVSEFVGKFSMKT